MHFELLFERILSILGQGLEAGVPPTVAGVCCSCFLHTVDRDGCWHPSCLAFAFFPFNLVQDSSSWDSTTYTFLS